MTNVAADTTPAIEAVNLTKVYGSGNTEVVAMKDVSLTVARGEVVALLGPSGAGKSTLLTAIGLINPPTAGRIVIALMTLICAGLYCLAIWGMYKSMVRNFDMIIRRQHQ